MSGLLGRLQQVGELHSRGEFTLDVSKAQAKLSRFQFPDEADFLYHLAAGLVALGAAELRLSQTGETLTITLPQAQPLAVPAELPELLEEALLAPDSPVRRLAAACHSLVGQKVGLFEWTLGGVARDYLQHHQEPLWPAGALTELRLHGLTSQLLRRAMARLSKAARWKRFPLYLEGSRVGDSSASFEPLGDHQGHFWLDPQLPEGVGQVHLVVDGLETDCKRFPCPLPWNGVVDWSGQAVLDASLAAVLEDDRYLELIEQHIPQTYTHAVQAACDSAEGEVTRQLLLGLCLRPDCQPWQPLLKQTSLFRTHDGKVFSLNQLGRLTPPVYFSATAPPADIQKLVVDTSDKRARAVVELHLGESAQELDQLLLQKIRRQQGWERWQRQPDEGSELPSSAGWLHRESNSYLECHYHLGIPNNWAVREGEVIFRYQGRFLARRCFNHEDVPFTLVCNLDESHINEVWDDVLDSNWTSLLNHWRYRIDEALKGLAHGGQLLDGPIRQHLLQHLATLEDPTRSFFSDSPMFVDRAGTRYSLLELVELRRTRRTTLAYLGAGESLEGIPESLLPAAIWFSEPGPALDCLRKVKMLAIQDYSQIPRSLRELQIPLRKPNSPWAVTFSEEWGHGWVSLLPEENPAVVRVWSWGHAMAQIPYKADQEFEAVVSSDQLRFDCNVIASGDPLWKLRTDEASWKTIKASLDDALDQSIHQRLQHPLHTGPWLEWARRCLIQGLGLSHPELLKIECFQDRSLQDWLDQKSLWWSSRELRGSELTFLEQELALDPRGPGIWQSLDPQVQNGLARVYGGNWQSADERLVRQEKLTRFLRKPSEPLTDSNSLFSHPLPPPLQGSVALIGGHLMDSGELRRYYLQRPVGSEISPNIPRGMRIRMQSSQLELDPEREELMPPGTYAELRSQTLKLAFDHLRDWLATPRPGTPQLVAYWSSWVQQASDLSDLLVQQPWLETSQGYRSLAQLQGEENLYSLPEARPDLPAELCILYSARLPGQLYQSLLARLPQLLNNERSEKHIQALERQARALQLRAQHQKKSAGLKVRSELSEPLSGAVGIHPKGSKEPIWLVRAELELTVSDLLPGWSGWVDTDRYKRRTRAGVESAELALEPRKTLLLQMLPAVLQRIGEGRLSKPEQKAIASYATQALHYSSPNRVSEEWQALIQARWIDCADDTLTSLEQLRLEALERGQLLYWTRDYWLKGQPPAELTPILNADLAPLVERWCGKPLELRQAPVWHRDVRELSPIDFRKTLEGLGNWVSLQGKRSVGRLFEGVMRAAASREDKPSTAAPQRSRQSARPAPETPKVVAEHQRGKAFLRAMRRQASQVLPSTNRAEVLGVLERAVWVARKKGLWTWAPAGRLELHEQHPVFQPWLGAEEPPPAVTFSLLLSLVAVVNARSTPFTDAMECDILSRVCKELVETYKDQMK